MPLLPITIRSTLALRGHVEQHVHRIAQPGLVVHRHARLLGAPGGAPQQPARPPPARAPLHPGAALDRLAERLLRAVGGHQAHCASWALASATASSTARCARSEPSVPTSIDLNTVSAPIPGRHSAARVAARPYRAGPSSATRSRWSGARSSIGRAPHQGLSRSRLLLARVRGNRIPGELEPLVLGVDVGGTKVAVAAVVGGRADHQEQSPHRAGQRGGSPATASRPPRAG